MFFSFYLYIGLSRHAVMKSFKSYCDAKAVFHSGRENGKTQEKMPWIGLSWPKPFLEVSEPEDSFGIMLSDWFFFSAHY